ncbi:MAG: glycoside hydrolase [Deltaproteobacteria bacterium]|nr:glycoside hydrolase [Deltaproteobacteria bacterium]
MSRKLQTTFFLLAMAAVACGGANFAGASSEGSTASDALVMPPAPKPVAQGAYYTGDYRNMLAEFGLSKAEIQQRVEHDYQQLFHGDAATQTVMYQGPANENGPSAYIKDIGSDDVRSEGMSYGMMFAVQLDKKSDFDALWNFAHTYMYHADENHPDAGYFAWSMSEDGTVRDDNPAPDGEEYFAMSLLFASNRWGDGDGIFNYGKAAKKILSDMIHREDKTGEITQWDGEKKQTWKNNATIVALMHPEYHMVRFSPNTQNFASNSDHTDPSYHVPAFYELFALWGPKEDAEFWKTAAAVSRDYFVKVAHPETGLTPDYAEFDGTPVAASWNPNTAHFGPDAYRTAMNWSVDCAWWGKDIKRQEELSSKLQRFFQSKGVYAHQASYTLDGAQNLVDYQSMGLTAMNAAASICSCEKVAFEFVEMLWRTPLKTGKWRYYDGMLTMFALLNLSGNYKIYKPAK